MAGFWQNFLYLRSTDCKSEAPKLNSGLILKLKETSACEEIVSLFSHWTGELQFGAKIDTVVGRNYTGR